MRYVLMFILTLLLSGTVAAAELSHEEFVDQFLTALDTKDFDKIVLLLQENPTTAQQVQQVAEQVEGEEEGAQQAWAMGELLGQLLEMVGNPELYQLQEQGEQAYYRSDFPTALQAWEKGLQRARELGSLSYIIQFIGNLGVVYSDLGQYAKALEYHEQALIISRNIGDRNGEGTAFGNIGLVYRELGQYTKALEYYEQALVISRDIGDRNHEGNALSNIGLVYGNLDQYAKALEYYEQALVISRDIGDRNGEGGDINNIGNVYISLGQYAKALEYHEQALVISRDIGDRNGEGIALGNIGLVYWNLSQYAKALEYYEQALVISRDIGDRNGEGTTLNNIGNVYGDLGQYAKALEYYEQALVISRDISDSRGEGSTLGNIGLVYRRLGQYTKALEYYEQALVIKRDIGDRNGEGSTLGNIGNVYLHLGQYAKALEYHEQALIISRDIGDRNGEGTTLGNIGLLYSDLGQYAKAIEYNEQALVIKRDIGDRNGEGGTLGNIGLVYWNLGQYAKALEYYEQALVISRDIGDRNGEGTTLNNIGNVYGNLGQYAKSLEYYEQALVISRDIGHRNGEGNALGNIGLVYLNLGQYAKARATLQQALQIVTTTGEPEMLWRIWNNLSGVSKSLNNPLAAIFYGKQAVNTLQTLRQHVAKLEDKSLHVSFLENKKDVYQHLADLQIAQGRIPEAQQVMALLKEEEYFDYLRRRRDALHGDHQASLNHLEQAQQEKLQQMTEPLIRLGKEYESLRRLPQRTEAQEQQMDQLHEQLSQAGQVFNRYLDELFDTFAQAAPERNRELGERQLAHLRSLQGTLRELGAGVVLLHYLSLEDKLHIIVTTGDTATPPVAHQVAVKETDLNCAIANFRALLAKEGQLSDCNSPDKTKALAKHLYDLLIAPIAEHLRQAEARTLLLYLDGSLRYIPFAALHDGERWLTETYATGIYTAAAQTKLTAPPQAQWRVAGLGVSKAHPGFTALPGVAQELKMLVRHEKNPDGLLQGVAYLDEQFNYLRFKRLLRDTYPVFHIASHFRLNPGAYDQSFLLLGDGAQLNLSLLKDDNLDFNGLDLLTLSACNTATGGTGAEIEGFGTLAQNQGAKSVLATLWQVNDDSTSLWMRQFYDFRQNRTLTKFEAIRQAQLALLSDQDTQHPHHWAAFILMGNGL
jgi:tetratricopeptide (TPR) repeat protein